MRVLVLTSSYPSADNFVGGIFIKQQAHAIGWEMNTAVFIPHVAQWRDVLSFKTRVALSIEIEDRISIFRSGYTVKPKSRLSFPDCYAMAAVKGFPQIQKSWGPVDVIHAHNVLPAGWAALAIKRRYGIPVVLTEHSGPFTAHFQSDYHKRIAEETLLNVDRVLAVSPFLKEQIVAHFPDVSVDVLGNLVDVDFFALAGNPSEKKEKTIFLSVSLLNENKGVQYLVEAAQELVRKNAPPFEVLIGGDGEYRTVLERQVLERGVGSYVRFLGMLKPEDVKACLQKCDALVMPSLHETFSMITAEAMACGKIVIATRCGGPESIVEDGLGILVQPAKPQELAEAMESVISGRISINPLKVRNHIQERFGKAAFLKSVSSVYRSVL